jgi:nitrogen regulatory protein P-II 1
MSSPSWSAREGLGSRKGVMKRVEVIIERAKLEEFKLALDANGIKGITVAEVHERAHRRGHGRRINGFEYHLDFLPKIRLDLILEDQLVGQAVDVISAAARSGQTSELTLIVSSVDEVIRIPAQEKQLSSGEVMVRGF